jgi:hypothetical protein
MSSNPVWKKDASGVEHPTHELIFAFIRGQCSEHEESRIRGHLYAGCVPCNRLHAGLTQESATLNQLKYISRYLYYPEIQPERVLLHAQRGEPLTSAWTGKRKRKFQVQSRPGGRLHTTRQYAPKTGLHVFRLSFPVAFGLLLILTTVAIVLAYTIASFVRLPFLLPGQQPNNFYFNHVSNTPDVVPHQPTPTNTVSVTVTPTPTVTATVVVVKGPTIETCSPPKYTGLYIFICGYNFKVGDQVSLVLKYYGDNAPVMRRSVIVDKRGEFMDSWNIYSCRYLPIAIYAVDVTQESASRTSNILTPVPMASCGWPTPSVTPGGY